MKRCSVLLIKRNANKNYNEVPLHTSQNSLFSHSVTSDSLRLDGLHHARLLCPSPSPRSLLKFVHWVGDAIQGSHPWPFLYSSVYSCYRFLISFASVSSIPFLSFIVPILHEMFPWFSNFLEKISHLSCFIVFLYFFALIT